MKFKKRIIHSLERCYCVSPLRYDREDCFLAASEKNAPCLLLDHRGALKDTVWTAPGGTMSLVPLPGANGQFLATFGFYSPNDAADAAIVYARPSEQGWKIQPLSPLPFVHRFDLLRCGGRDYLLAATLKSGMEHQDDWRYPGKLWAAPLPSADALEQGARLELKPIMDNVPKNHGFCKIGDRDRQFALIGSESGIFKVSPPDTQTAGWQIELLLDLPASDMALVDFDGDGQDELLVFSPFHGSTLEVYKYAGASYTRVFHRENLDFLHAIWAGTFHGVPMAVIGHRGGDQSLFTLTYDGQYRLTQIDSGAGPANVTVLPVDGVDSIVAANCEKNEIAVYTPCHEEA